MYKPALVCAVLTLAASSSAQLAWRLMTPAISPPARAEAGLAFDGQGVMLFGGAPYTYPVTLLDDTWRWDGQSWTNLRPANAPSARAASAIAYDPVRQRVILFGGWDYPLGRRNYLDDMWEWDGQNWRELTLSVRPPRMAYPQMVYDPVRHRIVLLGAFENSGIWAALETWEWDGTVWTQTSSPGQGALCLLSFDAVQARPLMVLHRPVGTGNTSRTETWTYAAGVWFRYGPSSSPPARDRSAMAFDQARRRVTLFGGVVLSGGGNANDTWEWDGGGWQQLSLGNAPTPRIGHALAYDPVRRGLVAFGGHDGTSILSDTWELTNPDLGDFARFGTGCSGSAGTPALDSVPSGSFPNIGEGFAIRVTSLPVSRATFLYLGFSRASWNGIALPFDLAPIGAPGCPLLVSPDFVLPLANLGGIAPLTLPIPNDAGLVGIRMFVQGWVSDPGANQLGIVVSNAGAGLIGRR